MKKFEFETSKGKFVLADSYVENGIDLKQITEEQASEIVGSIEEILLKDDCFDWFRKSTKSLYSLIESQGVHLFKNPVPEPEYIIDNFGNGGICEHWVSTFQEQEQNTFYNPYIFKI